jgi:carotenoid cleavage dioxygenase-like enzyme
MADGQTVYEINPNNLSTIGHFNTQKVFGLLSICPEIMKDRKTGDLYIIGSTIKPMFHNAIVKMTYSNKDKRLEDKFHPFCSIPSRWKKGPCGLRKSLALTENYIVFIETPLIANLMKVAATHIKNYRMIDWLDWMPNDKVRFYLMQKTTGKLIKVEYLSSTAFLVWDIVNAYEENDKVSMYMFIFAYICICMC